MMLYLNILIMLDGVVWGEICGGQFDVEQVSTTSEVEWAGRGVVAGALFEDIFDVLAGVGLAPDSVLDSEGNFFAAVNIS